MNAPRVSIGMPVHNGMPFIETALRSLAAQTFEDLEIVISDNASTDESLAVAQSWAARDDRIRVVQQSINRGAAQNFNDVYRQSRGEYFKWATADDCCRPEMVERCVNVLDSNSGAALCYAQTLLIDETGREIAAYEDGLHLDETSGPVRFRELLKRIDRANAVFGVFRREVLAGTGLIGSFPMSDLVLLAEVAMRGQFHEVPERLFLRRMHAEQSMEKYHDRQARAQWFRPGRTPGRLFPCWRVLLEFWKAIGRAPLSGTEQAAAFVHTRLWIQRYWKDHARDLRAGLRQVISPPCGRPGIEDEMKRAA